MFVADHMKRSPITVQDQASVFAAQSLLEEHRIHQLPVVDESSRLSGLITDVAIRAAIGYDVEKGASIRVAEVMVFDPDTIPLNATLDQAVSMLWSKRINALPVLMHDKLVGIFTKHDALRAFHEMLGLDREGGIIEVALPAPGEDLAFAFGAIKDRKSSVISAVVCNMRRDGKEPTLYLRVDVGDRQVIERSLRDAGLVLLVPEQP